MSLKIAQIVCVYPPYKSGISTSALATARIFSSVGHEVETFTLKSSLSRGAPSDSEAGCVAGGQVVRLKAFLKFGNGGFLPQLFWRLKNFDIVYLHYPFFGAIEIIWFLKRFIWKNKTRLVIHFHMEPELSSRLLKFLSWPSRLIAPSLFKQADSVICASLDYAKINMPAEIFSANINKIKEIPFSVDTEIFRPAWPQSSARDCGEALGDSSFRNFGAENDKKIFKILFVGGLDKAHYFKGLDVLLKALALLNKDVLNWKLEIVGSGDLQGQYEKQARDFGIADKIIFAGNVIDDDLPKKYQEADCFVLASINKGEAFGVVLIEAMASGLPVIASDLPGMRGVFTEASGLKVKPGDVKDLREKIKYLMDNPVKRTKMGVAARREAEEKYSKEEVSKKLIKEIEYFL